MTKRLKIIASHIGKGRVFADIGCDHGIIAKYVLDNELFETVIASDISNKSLDKAKKLLNKYGSKVTFLVSDGFNKFHLIPDEAVIAGMGGEEICSILSNAKFLPKRLILSPQKNQSKVRELLIRKNYKISDDYTVFDKKFYDVIVAEIGSDRYSDLELLFGRDNLKLRPKDFILKLKNEEKKINIILNNNSASENVELINYLKTVKEILNED